MILLSIWIYKTYTEDSINFYFMFSDKYFTKDIPDKLKMTLKGGAAVDPESGQYHIYPKYWDTLTPYPGGGRVVQRCCVAYITGASN